MNLPSKFTQKPGALSRSLGPLLLASLLAFPGFVFAAADDWTSTTSGAWGTAGNWSGGVPIATSTATFNTVPGLQAAVTLAPASVAASLSFSAAGGATAYTFDTAGTANINVLTLSAGIVNAAAANQTFYNTFTLAGAQSWTATGGGLIFNGNVNLGVGPTSYALTLNGANAIAIAGNIANGGTTAGSLVYSGSSNLTLTGNNTYTGATTISSGTVTAGSANALGTTTAGTTVASGATLAFQGGVAIAEDLAVAGIGATANAGAVSNTSGTNTLTGNIAQTAATTYSAAAGTQLTLAGNTTGNFAVTYGKGTATGTLVLFGANSYTAATAVAFGTVLAASNGALGNGTTTVASGATLGFSNNVTNSQAVGLSGTGVAGSAGALESFSGTNTVSGTVTLNANSTLGAVTGQTLNLSGTVSLGTRALTFGTTAGAGNVNVSGPITGSGPLTAAFGTTTLNGANTFTGATTINSGATLVVASNAALGPAGNGSDTTVASGGVLVITGGVTTANTGRLLLSGVGAGSGAFRSLSGNNTWEGSLQLATKATIYSGTAGNTLFLNSNYVAARTFTLGANILTVDGPGDVWANSNIGVIGDTGGLIKNGSGKLTLYGYNTFYTGATVVNSGSLDLIVGPFTAGWYGINGTLTIGTGLPAAAGSATVNIASNSYVNQISPTSAVTVNSEGVLNVGAATTVGALTLNGGTVNVGAGAAITPTSIASNANSAQQTSQILGGQITLSGALAITTTHDAALTTDLNISSAIAAGANSLSVNGGGNTTLSGALTGTAASSLAKNGAGMLILAAANPNFLGAIAINAGTLQTNLAGAFTSANSVVVAAGATLATNGFNQTVGAFTNNGVLDLGSGSALTLTAISALNGTLMGSGTVILNTGSILTLGANFNNPNVNFQLNGGTLKLNGTNDVFGNLIVSANSVIDFSGGAVADFASISFPGGSILTVNNWSDTVSFFYSNTTIGTQGSAPANQIVFNGNSGSLTRWNAYTDGPSTLHQVTPIPEPSTYGAIFFGLSFAGVLCVRARRKKLPSTLRSF